MEIDKHKPTTKTTRGSSPVPVLVDDVRDLDDLPEPEVQLVLQLRAEALLHLGELLDGAAEPRLLGRGQAVVPGVGLPAHRHREQA